MPDATIGRPSTWPTALSASAPAFSSWPCGVLKEKQMFPILFSYGPLQDLHLWFFPGSGLSLSMYVAGREAKRRGGSPEQIYDLSFYSIVAAIIGSRLIGCYPEVGLFFGSPPGNLHDVERGFGVSRRSHFRPADHGSLYPPASDGFMDHSGYHGLCHSIGTIHRSFRVFYGRLLLWPRMPPTLGRYF